MRTLSGVLMVLAGVALDVFAPHSHHAYSDCRVLLLAGFLLIGIGVFVDPRGGSDD